MYEALTYLRVSKLHIKVIDCFDFVLLLTTSFFNITGPTAQCVSFNLLLSQILQYIQSAFGAAESRNERNQ